MFDTGNAVMVAGGTYALTSAAIGERSEHVVKTIVKKLFSSVLFDTYFVVFLMMVFQIRIPTPSPGCRKRSARPTAFLRCS